MLLSVFSTQKMRKQTWPKNLDLIIWNINSNKVRAIKLNPMPKEVNIWWTKIFVKWFLAWHWWYYGKKQRGVEGPSNCFAARGRFDVCIRRPGKGGFGTRYHAGGIFAGVNISSKNRNFSLMRSKIFKTFPQILISKLRILAWFFETFLFFYKYTLYNHERLCS